MPLPVPSPSPAASAAPAKQLQRSSLPTPSKRPPSSTSTAPSPSQQDTLSSPMSRLPSPQRFSRPLTAVPGPRQSLDNDNNDGNDRSGTPSEAESVSDSSRMPPPPAPPRTRSGQSSVSASSKEKDSGGEQPPPPKKGTLGRAGSVIRRATGTRNLKDKEDEKKASTGVAKKSELSTARIERSIGLRGSTAARSSSVSTAGSLKEKEKGAVTGRNMRSRTASGASVLSSASTTAERPRTSSISITRSAAAVARKEPASASRERSGTNSSRRPTSMYSDFPPSVSSTAPAAPRKAATATGGSTTRGHRRNISTPSTTQVPAPPARPGTAASTASNVSKSRRPPFSTLRQDFNAPPSAPSTSRRSMPPPPLDASTIHQQAQLLQYTCLYSNSHATYAQLTASATAKLKRRFDTLAREHSRSREQLARRQRLHDLTGLTVVVETPAAGITGKRRETMRSAEEKIQAFSESIKKLEALRQNEHLSLTGVFGEWISGYSPPSPRHGINQGGWVSKRGKWIDGLGEDWRRQCLFISRRIESAVKAIETVVSAVMMEEEAGVISVVSERWMDIARGMLEESQGMLQVEQNVVSRERLALEDVVAGTRASVVPQLETGVVAAEGEETGIWTRC